MYSHGRGDIKKYMPRWGLLHNTQVLVICN